MTIDVLRQCHGDIFDAKHKFLICNEKGDVDRYDTNRDEFAWHSKLLTNRLRFIILFVVINELTKI